MKKRIREQYPDTFVNVINSSDVVGFYIQRPGGDPPFLGRSAS